jgi:hypothetical protein
MIWFQITRSLLVNNFTFICLNRSQPFLVNVVRGRVFANCISKLSGFEERISKLERSSQVLFGIVVNILSFIVVSISSGLRSQTNWSSCQRMDDDFSCTDNHNADS